MKKRTLLEEIKRIQEITYGNRVTKNGFIGNLLGEQSTTKIDDPKKADFVGTDISGKELPNKKLVQDFYDTLENAINSGGLTQQKSGSYTYQKEVESMQIALELLNYDLPKFGVDGLFGPETASAVIKYSKDNDIGINKDDSLNENSEEIRSTLSDLGYSEKGNEIDNGGEVSDDISSILTKILKDFKITNPDVKITVTGGNDKFHKGLGYSSKHTEGKAIDLTISPYNTKNLNSFRSLLDKYQLSNSNFTYYDEYTNPSGAATAGHFHLQYGKGGTKNSKSPKISGVVATPELLKKLLDSVKTKNLTPQELRTFMDKVVIGNGGGGKIDAKDWQGIINTIIDNLEGGYYHPDMLNDGRINDVRYESSGETMFGIDRKNGPESKTSLGLEFWKLIDNENARYNWESEQGMGRKRINPDLDKKLRSLVAQMMKPFFDDYTKQYLTSESASIVENDPALTFHFAYATFNGSGWFHRFAKVINKAVADGVTDPKELLKLSMEDRMNTGSSIMTQVAPKVKKITDRISSNQV
jgi:hypothetical protein